MSTWGKKKEIKDLFVFILISLISEHEYTLLMRSWESTTWSILFGSTNSTDDGCHGIRKYSLEDISRCHILETVLIKLKISRYSLEEE